MKITREQLLESDFDTLFTRDPGLFIEAIVINLMWAKDTKSEALTIERQRYIFEQWLQYYADTIREETMKAYVESGAEVRQTNWQQGFRAGQIDALSNLPIKKSVLTKYVDLIEVANILRRLKAQQVLEASHERSA